MHLLRNRFKGVRAMKIENGQEYLLKKSDKPSKKDEFENNGFGEKLSDAIKEINRLQNVADDSIENVIKGKVGIHEGMLAIQEADLSLRMFLQVRKKVMDAYSEIMRMPV